MIIQQLIEQNMFVSDNNRHQRSHPKMTQKKQGLLLNKLIRSFKSAISQASPGQHICYKSLLKIFHHMGYVQQYPTQQSQQLTHTISYMLSQQKDCLISEQSLFNFICVLHKLKGKQNQFRREIQGLKREHLKMGVQPLIMIRIGNFNQYNDWYCDQQQQAQLRNVFGTMLVTKIARQNIRAENKINQQNVNPINQTFQPHILNKSRDMAYKKHQSLAKQRVQDRLLHTKSVQKSNLQHKVLQSIQKQMKQCYFKPKTNKHKALNYSLSKYIDSMNTSYQNKQNNQSISNIFSTDSKNQSHLVGDKLLIKGKQYENNLLRMKKSYVEEKSIEEMRECTFQPKLTQKVYQNKHVKIRNADKSIQRVKQARQKREFQLKVKQRGYPKNVDWAKYISTFKSNYAQGKNHQNKKPILCIDLKIFNETKNIKVYQGQTIEQISKSICLQNKVPPQFWCRVQSLLKSSLSKCAEIKILDDQIFINAENQWGC